ncbi:hypothetical protein IV203_009914 [Nitzschia inconspicua]|uniref:SET domain-containing protein n=1 Tax=Nitzschia inconspicua TaxID=303405 RepID=A0A9K3KV54_9STRA|nr:hypothetical protein IV203_009914 [Nitzschia inconspicua]
MVRDMDFLRDTIDKIRLSFVYVALRDSKQGQEVFMDYGDEWAEAWEKHVEQWEPQDNEKGYVHSSFFNIDYKNGRRTLV